MRKITTASVLAGFLSFAAAPAGAVTFTFSDVGAIDPNTSVVCDFTVDDCGFEGDFVRKNNSDAFGAQLPGAPASNFYLAVPGPGPFTDQIAVFSLTEFASNIFSFDWGSIDQFNSLALVMSNGNIFDIGGAAVLEAGGTFGNQVADPSNRRVTFNTASSGVFFTEARFKSTGQAFEIDNLAVGGAVPEPGTWMLMILGLGAVGFAMRRKQNTAVRVQFA